MKQEESRSYCEEHGLTKELLENATQIAWATGGKLVPEDVRKEYLNTYITEEA